MYTIEATRRALEVELANNNYRGNTVELRGWTICLDMANDRHSILGEPNEKYIKAEIQWYNEQSRSVNRLAEIYGKRVAIWDSIADNYGQVNSNYGWSIFSSERGYQFEAAVRALRNNNLTRQAVMIYQSPMMHNIAIKDFTCTNAVHYYITEEDKLEVLVQMRSNDAVFGFNNDYAWQHHVADRVAKKVGVELGHMIWQAASLHVYDRHFHLLEAS